MGNKKFLWVIFLLVSPLLVLFAQEKTYKAPRKSEVVIVTSLKLTPALNDSFFSQYRTINKNHYYTFAWDVVRGVEKTTAMLGVAEPITKELLVNKTFYLGGESELNCITVKVPDDRVIKLTYMQLNLANLSIFSIYFPIQMEFTVPEGASYVYIGSLNYALEGFNFEITGFRFLDEYDHAVTFVKEKFSQNANLVRVPMREISEEDRKRITYP